MSKKNESFCVVFSEELRQAVVDGNYYLVRRALACAKQYNLNLPDNKGHTLLMNAVLKGKAETFLSLSPGDRFSNSSQFSLDKSENNRPFFFCVLPVPRRKCVCDRFRFPTV
jgi:hypothetical protein